MKNNKNTKGFSLIELLVTLLILVIVVYIAFTLITEVSNKAKIKGFRVTLDNMEKWITQQYEMSIYTGNITDTNAFDTFSSICGRTGEKCFYNYSEETKHGVILDLSENNQNSANLINFRNFITASGSNPENYSKVVVAIDKESKKICVKASISTTGQFFYEGIVEDGLNYYQSQSCKIEIFSDVFTPTESYAYH